MKKLTKLILVTLVTLLIASTASAATLKVPSQYKTIQKAVNAANDGDTIQVANGKYQEVVTVKGKYLNIYGRTQGGKYKYYPQVQGINLRSGGVINGFTFTKSGVSLSKVGENTIRNNYFLKKGVNVVGETCSYNTIMNNQFFNCGISLSETYENTIKGNTINSADVGLGVYKGADAMITGNTFSKCKVGYKGYYVPADLKKNNKFIKNKKNIVVDLNL